MDLVTSDTFAWSLLLQSKQGHLTGYEYMTEAFPIMFTIRENYLAIFLMSSWIIII